MSGRNYFWDMKWTPIIILAAIVLSCNTKKKPEASIELASAETINIAEHAAKTDELPAFKMQNANGSAVNLQSLKGKKVMVNIWASWCPPCKREMPSIEKARNLLQNENIVFLLASDESVITEAWPCSQGLC